MRKYITFLLLIVLLFASLGVNAEETLPVSLVIDGKLVECDVPPMIEGGRTLVPARALFESLNAEVLWDGQMRKVTIIHGNKEIILFENSNEAIVDNLYKYLEVPARVVNGRTMVPIRFVAESLNCEVEWISAERKVVVNTSGKILGKNNLTEVLVESASDYTQITIRGVANAKMTEMMLDKPNRYVFDFADTYLKSMQDSISVNAGNVVAVRLGQFDKTVTRVVVDVNKFDVYSIDKQGSDVIITIGGFSVNSPVTNYTETTESTGNAQNTSVTTVAGTLPQANENAKKHLVIIDPGHGGAEVGTIGKKDGAEIYEKTINIDIALQVRDMLQSAGINIYMMRQDDSAIDILQRPVIGNEKKGTLFLSIHNNASTNTGVKGTQVYYSDETAKFSNMTNKQVASVYYDNITNALGLRRAGLVDNPRYIVIYRSNMPSLIIEGAFMSNQEDLSLLLDANFRTKLAYQISKSTIEVLNVAQ